MTTGWLLLQLVLFVSSQSVDGQSTTDDENCNDEGLLRELQKDVERLFQQQQRLTENQQQLLNMFQQQQSMNDIGIDNWQKISPAIYFIEKICRKQLRQLLYSACEQKLKTLGKLILQYVPNNVHLFIFQITMSKINRF